MYKQKHIHFVGIGGIGMSGIAEILKHQGYIISGCDSASDSKLLQRLRSLECDIYHGHCASHIESADILVYSSDIDNSIPVLHQKTNPDIKAALSKNIPIIPRALMLAELMRTKYSVAIAGMHGKTTTTSLISHIFLEAQRDPTIIIGGILKNRAYHATLGKSDLLIAEADESDRSFLYLTPTVAVVTNIDREHLDTYKDLEDIKNAFKDFLNRLPFYGKAFVCIDDPGVQSILPLPQVPVVTYGLSTQADVQGIIKKLEPHQVQFDVICNNPKFLTNSFLGCITLSMAGKHNVLNALAAISLALEFDISFQTIQRALSTFGGVERRFEFKGMYKEAHVFDDYGHHPTEIQCVLDVAYEKKKNKLIIIFQPQRYSRTEKLWDDFVEVFSKVKADKIYITDIHPANEKPREGITSPNLVKAIQGLNQKVPVYYYPLPDIEQLLDQETNKDDLIITLGAGKLHLFADYLVSK